MPVTIGDVARKAGVGRGTVSRVLNNKPNVDPDTRARVQAVIDELDFVPSAAARRLSMGRSMTVGVVVPFLTRPSVVERLRGIELSLVELGLDMITMNVESAERRDAVLRTIARPERIDGLILVSIAPHEEELARIQATGLPLVLLDAHHRSVPRVVMDDVDGGRIAAKHLLEHGHRSLGFIGDVPRPGFGFSSSRLRLRGVEQALRDEGLAIRSDHLGLAEHSRQNARHSAEAMLARPDHPTAIVAASDTEAIGVLEAAASLGLNVPGDVSVIGYDDLEAADFVGLTTVRQPLAESGERAVARLEALIGGRDDGPLREVMPVSLVVRRTTGRPPAA
jgi:DNA-binding LacI/PurR family transcriptional regulator